MSEILVFLCVKCLIVMVSVLLVVSRRLVRRVAWPCVLNNQPAVGGNWWLISITELSIIQGVQYMNKVAVALESTINVPEMMLAQIIRPE